MPTSKLFGRCPVFSGSPSSKLNACYYGRICLSLKRTLTFGKENVDVVNLTNIANQIRHMSKPWSVAYMGDSPNLLVS